MLKNRFKLPIIPPFDLTTAYPQPAFPFNVSKFKSCTHIPRILFLTPSSPPKCCL